MKRKKVVSILILILLVIIFYLCIYKTYIQETYDDILFFKFLRKTPEIEKTYDYEKNSDIIEKYIFKVNHKNTNFKDIDLLQTINKKFLINKKLAPGINGSFQIILKTNQNTNYNVIFKEKNTKPKNLIFMNSETKEEKDNIEDFNNELKGILLKNEKKTITIKWFWKYENNEEENKEDTIDGKNLKNYLFTIYVNGESLN